MGTLPSPAPLTTAERWTDRSVSPSQSYNLGYQSLHTASHSPPTFCHSIVFFPPFLIGSKITVCSCVIKNKNFECKDRGHANGTVVVNGCVIFVNNFVRKSIK